MPLLAGSAVDPGREGSPHNSASSQNESPVLCHLSSSPAQFLVMPPCWNWLTCCCCFGWFHCVFLSGSVFVVSADQVFVSVLLTWTSTIPSLSASSAGRPRQQSKHTWIIEFEAGIDLCSDVGGIRREVEYVIDKRMRAIMIGTWSLRSLCNFGGGLRCDVHDFHFVALS